MKRNRFAALSLIVLGAIGLARGLEALGDLAGVGQFESYTLDRRQQTTAESFQIGVGDRESEVVLVLFDEFSVMDSIEGWPWLSPFPRKHLAELIDALALAGARTIGVDVYLDKLFDQLNEWDGGDDLLRGAIERAGYVVLVTPLEQTDSGPISVPPHDFFADVAAGVGTAELPASFETFRDGTLVVRSGDALAPSFVLAVYAHARGLDVDSILDAAMERGRIDLPGLPASLGKIDPEWFDGSGTSGDAIVPFRIRYIGPPSSADAADQPGTFPAVASGSLPSTAMFLPELFRGKIVLLGTGFHEHDRFRTRFYAYEPLPDSTLAVPPEPYGWMYGVEIHANALQNIIDGEYVHTLGSLTKVLLLLVVAVLTGGVAFRSGAGGGGAVLAVTILGIIAYSFWAWAGSVYLPRVQVIELGEPFLWIPMGVLILCAAFSYVGSVAYVSIVEGKEKRFIKGAFGMYLSPDIVAEISENPAALQLGGEKRPLSLLFSDLSGFTTISENMDAQDLVAILNEYLDDMTQVVIDEMGYLDKYIGDAIMAFWNAPKDVEDHPDRAIRTAIIMQRHLDALNDRWSADDPDRQLLEVRIGVHTGEVVVGNVGGKASFNYSAIGDAVNLAARLEPANKTYHTHNMVSEATLRAATGEYRVRELDYITVVGKEEPVKVYELLEMAGVELTADREQALELYGQALTAYKRHDWAAAKESFQAAAEACPEDGPSRLYVTRCDVHIADPPPPDWDFVVRRTEK